MMAQQGGTGKNSCVLFRPSGLADGHSVGRVDPEVRSTGR